MSALEPGDAAGGGVLVRRGVERRTLVLLAAAALFVEVFGLRQLSDDTGAGIALLYVVPVALTALELGLVAGLMAGALATALTGLWALTAAAELGVVGMLTRSLVFVAVGAIAGRFADRMRSAQRRQAELLRAAVDLARLDKAGDMAVVLAAYAARVGDARGVRVRVDGTETIERARPGRGAEVFEVGDDAVLEVELRRTGVVADEERAALAMLAVQARVARENQFLLESERERRLLEAELREAHERLIERGRQLRGVLDTHERERREVAHELREDAAQALAAVLLGLHLLKRDIDSADGDEQLSELREHVDSTMQSLSAIAVNLRPPALDGIGLAAALERLVGSPRAPGLDRIVVDVGEASGLDADTETAVYRVVEDAVRSVAGRREARVAAELADGPLTVTVRTLEGNGTIGDLTVLRARLDLLGGSVEAHDRKLIVRVPLQGKLAASR